MQSEIPIRRILVTGGCGFIGSNFLRRILESDPALEVTNLDVLTYAGNPENLAGLEDQPRYHFVRGDIADRPTVLDLVARGGFDAIVNFAAESHVDRSIDDATPFLRTNVLGTQCLLDAARAAGVRRYIQVSTDEVYGTLGPDDAPFRETTPLTPNSPYAASKAGADLLVRAAHHTFGLDTVITRCSNNYGPYQFPEKLIPLFITNALSGIPVPVYGDGRQVRDWIHVSDHCRGIEAALRRGRAGAVYNFGGRCERYNIDVTRTILGLCGQPEGLIRHVTDRPGHDRRYAVECTKAESELGWRPTISFGEGLAATVSWYRAHAAWVDRVRSGAYRAEESQIPARRPSPGGDPVLRRGQNAA
jgi:dTDP-glucose 4,6-dehydratase